MLSIPEADLDLSDPAFAVPIDQAVVRLRAYLRSKNYTPAAIADVLDHASRWGTCEGSAVEPEDLDGAEATLPWDDLGYAAPFHSWYRYSTTEGDGNG